MKALKIIGGVFAIIVAAFFSVGLIVPSYEYGSSIEVNASPEKCWKTFHNVTLMKAWLRGFESLTLKKGDSLAIGSVYEIVVNDDDHRMVMSERVMSVSTPNKVFYELNNDVLKSEYSFSFEGDTTTRISSQYKITGNNIAWKAILFLSKSYMSNAAKDQLSSLKRVIETQPN